MFVNLDDISSQISRISLSPAVSGHRACLRLQVLSHFPPPPPPPPPPHRPHPTTNIHIPDTSYTKKYKHHTVRKEILTPISVLKSPCFKMSNYPDICMIFVGTGGLGRG